MSTTFSKFYKVLREKDVAVEIFIGHGQVGDTTIYLGNEKIVENKKGNFEHNLGRGENLNGKSLFCSTIVSDVRSETNNTSVTYKIHGGVNPYEQIMQETVESQGDVVFYTATFTFYI